MTMQATEGGLRPDLLLSERRIGGYLLIEFKRPSKLIDRRDQAQAQEYRDDLEAKFSNISVLLLGKGRDDSAAKNDPPELKVLGYEGVISGARSRLEWLVRELRAETRGMR